MKDKNKKSIYVTKPYLPPIEEYIEKIKSIWDSHQLTNMGPLSQQLNTELTNYLKVKYLLLFSNGHSALEAILRAMDLKGEVITTPFTFVSTTNAIVRCGLKPVFCDIRESDYTIDPEKIESCITEKTTAIVAVHVYGNPCDVIAIERIAHKHHLKVIYDAAHAFGVSVNGIGIGNYGDATMFSFHATKTFHTVEGGAVTFSDSKLGINFYLQKNFGIIDDGVILESGGNAKMSEFHAAMGLCNLDHIEEIVESRKLLFDRYLKRLSKVAGLVLPKKNEGNYAYFPVLVQENIFGKTRDELVQLLKRKNIYCRKYFYPLTSESRCYIGVFDSNRTPVAKAISEKIICLPIYDSLSLEDQDRICNEIIRISSYS